jgi:hypothetical protein
MQSFGGCALDNGRRNPMPKMWFWRDVDNGPGCLEYGWVSDGHRHPLILLPREEQKSETDQIDEPQALVEVYRLANNNRVGLDEIWQFPPRPPQSDWSRQQSWF